MKVRLGVLYPWSTINPLEKKTELKNSIHEKTLIVITVMLSTASIE